MGAGRLFQHQPLAIWHSGWSGFVGDWIVEKKRQTWGFVNLFLTPYVATHSMFAYTAVLMPMLHKKWQIILFILLWAMTLTIS